MFRMLCFLHIGVQGLEAFEAKPFLPKFAAAPRTSCHPMLCSPGALGPQGPGSRVKDLGFRLRGLGFRGKSLRFRGEGLA